MSTVRFDGHDILLFSLIMFVWCVMSQLLSELNEIQSFLTAQKNTLGKHFTEVRDAQAKGLVGTLCLRFSHVMSRMHVLGFCLWEGGLVAVKVCPGDTTSLVYLPEQSWIGILDAKVPQLLAFTVHVEKTSSAPGMLLPGEEAPHEAHSESSEQPWSFGKSVMQDTTLRQFEMMDDEVSIPREWPCLLKAQSASSKISDMISMALQLPATVVVKSSRKGIIGWSLLRPRSTANTLAK